MKTVACVACGLEMVKVPSEPKPHWEPHAPYWNPATDERYCAPDYWRSLYGTEPPKNWVKKARKPHAP